MTHWVLISNASAQGPRHWWVGKSAGSKIDCGVRYSFGSAACGHRPVSEAPQLQFVSLCTGLEWS